LAGLGRFCWALIAVAFLSAAAKPETVLRGALEQLQHGEIPTAVMTKTAARQTRTDLDLYLRDALANLGPLKSLYGMGKIGGLQQFQATYEHGWIQWRVSVRPDGKIGELVPFSINAPGTD
jgi:hypothetical protein